MEILCYVIGIMFLFVMTVFWACLPKKDEQNTNPFS